MNNKGFILAETITMSVILLVTFGFVYLAANQYLVRQKTAVFYDDVATIYQAHYIKEALGQYSNLNSKKDTIISSSYGMTIGSQTSGLFLYPDAFYKIADSLNLHQIFFTNNISGLKTCARNVNMTGDSNKCQNTFIDEELRAFINTINVTDLTNKYYLIFTFKRNNLGEKCDYEECFSHYTWVAL